MRIVVLAACAALFSPEHASADGAIAVGMTQDVVKDGFAYGWAVNYDSKAEARNFALDNCRKRQEAKRAAMECRLIATFKNECASIAMDPKAGTPGVGWAVASNKSDAEERALAHCKLTAGSSREQFCEISESKCDGVKQ
jgi:hypothetical protein